MPTDLTYYYTQVKNNPTATPEAKAEADRFFASRGTIPAGSGDSAGTGSLENTMPEQNNGVLGNLRIAMRTALTEAAQRKSAARITSMSPMLEGGASPNVITAAIGLAQQGLTQSQESIFSDAVKVAEDKFNEIKFNPDQFRSAQGGIYDIKNNKWVVSPSDSSDSSSTTSKTMTRTDVQQLGLPVALVGTSWTMFQQQLSSDVAPKWFQTMVEGQLKQSLIPKKLSSLWVEFKNKFNSAFNSKSSGGSSSGSDAGGLPSFSDF